MGNRLTVRIFETEVYIYKYQNYAGVVNCITKCKTTHFRNLHNA